jgi:hypothetical protein
LSVAERQSCRGRHRHLRDLDTGQILRNFSNVMTGSGSIAAAIAATTMSTGLVRWTNGAMSSRTMSHVLKCSPLPTCAGDLRCADKCEHLLLLRCTTRSRRQPKQEVGRFNHGRLSETAFSVSPGDILPMMKHFTAGVIPFTESTESGSRRRLPTTMIGRRLHTMPTW